MIDCVKLKEKLPALEQAPFRGEMGERILKQISPVAWNLWLVRQTKLINEYRLDPLDVKAQQFLKEEMLLFLFSSKS